jgi:hypothetical protein
MGVFLILLSLSFVGFNLNFFVDPMYLGDNPVVSAILQQFTLSFWVLLIAFISVVIYFVKRN